MQDLFDGPLFAAVPVLPVFPDVGDVQERGALQPDFDERALHSRKDARDAPKANIADQAARAGTLDVQLLHHALFEHGDARLLRRDVDQDLMHDDLILQHGPVDPG